MQTGEIIGKTVTNIYSLLKMEVGGLDTCECFIELDNKYIIDIPLCHNDDIWLKELNKEAVSLFADLSDYPIYYVNKNNKTVGEIADSYQRQRQNIFNRLRKFLFGQDIVIKDYQPYKVDYRENKLKHIKNRKIVDFIWYADDTDKGLLLLDNGYLISEITVAPYGTGLAGLNYFESLENLIERRGNEYLKLTDAKKGSH
ncbi:MAG TPA: hypothetical protein PLE30_02640 [Candidatus Kapabacteria bacterium]|nr:hypothetical protein [Candidatus Kapabacteria bacterium]